MKYGIGEKIKSMAALIAVAFAVAGLFTGIWIIAEFDLGLMGLVVIAIGAMIASLVYLLMSGFGQLVTNSDIVASHYARVNEVEEKEVAEKEEKRLELEKKAARQLLEDPDVPDDVSIEFTCPECSEKLFFVKSEFTRRGYVICPHCGKQIEESSI